MSILTLKIQKVNTELKKLNRISFIIIITFLLFSLSFCFNFFLGFIKQKDIIIFDLQNSSKNIVFLFVTNVILAPIIETFLGQSFPYYLLRKVKYLRERGSLILIVSSLFFGLIHFYSIFYIVYAFLMGLILMYGYLVRIRNDNKTFLLIVICHSLLNLGIFIINLF
jgi:hypothetical protein